MGKLWRFLGSRRLSAILLAMLLLASVLASLLPQMPSDPAAREPWLAAVQLRTRTATGLLHTLGWFDAYHAPWFLALLVALLLNTLICTVQRLPGLWKVLTRPPVATRPDAFYEGFAHRAEWPVLSVEAGSAAAGDMLARHRYRPHVERDERASSASLYAERGRWTQAGTLVSHLAGMLLVASVLARPALSWQETGVVLMPGQIYAPERGPTIGVEAGQLSIERHPDGQPRNYAVPMTILLDGSPERIQVARINHPLTFRGIAFHLQGYGPAVQVATPDRTYDLAFAEGQTRELVLPDADVTLRVAYQPVGALPGEADQDAIFVEAISAHGTLLGSGIVADGTELIVQGVPVTLALSSYTTWQVSHDPTFGLAVGTACLMVAGIVVSLWVPERRVWMRIDGRSTRMVGAGEFDGEFEALAQEMADACRPEEESDGQ